MELPYIIIERVLLILAFFEDKLGIMRGKVASWVSFYV